MTGLVGQLILLLFPAPLENVPVNVGADRPDSRNHS